MCLFLHWTGSSLRRDWIIGVHILQLVTEVWRLKERTGKSKCKRWSPGALRRSNKEANVGTENTKEGHGLVIKFRDGAVCLENCRKYRKALH